MATEWTVTRRVEFFETDMAGIVHFSNFFRYMEYAEHEFYRANGIAIHHPSEPALGWPRVQATCNYKHPVRFQDLLQIRLKVEKITQKTVQYRFEFRRLNQQPPLEVAVGQMTVVCVRRDNSESGMTAIAIPESICAKLTAPAAGSPRP